MKSNDKEPLFDCLAVTDVKVYPLPDYRRNGPLKAIAQIVLNDQLVLRGLRVMEGSVGLFVGYPVDPFSKGEDFQNIYNPITRQLREHIENCVLEKYQSCIGED